MRRKQENKKPTYVVDMELHRWTLAERRGYMHLLSIVHKVLLGDIQYAVRSNCTPNEGPRHEHDLHCNQTNVIVDTSS